VVTLVNLVKLALAISVTAWYSLETVLLSYLMGADRFRAHFPRILSAWSSKAIRVLGVEVRVHGAPPEGAPVVYVCNHMSNLDIPVVLNLVPEAKVLAKTELFRIPVFGRAMTRAGILEIDRGNRSRAFRTIDTAVERVRAGTSILVFAEGTRARDDRVGPFKKGGFVLATKAGVPVVPLAVRGTFGLLPKGSFLEFRPGTVHASFGEAIDPALARNAGKDALLAATRDSVVRLFESLPPARARNGAAA
jgi:1-acyl-sn-glycerol-3-phosphate acyltransferase